MLFMCDSELSDPINKLLTQLPRSVYRVGTDELPELISDVGADRGKKLHERVVTDDVSRQSVRIYLSAFHFQ